MTSVITATFQENVVATIWYGMLWYSRV